MATQEEHIGFIELGETYFAIVERNSKLIAGTICNAGLIEHYEHELDLAFSKEENLQMFLEDLIEKDHSNEL